MSASELWVAAQRAMPGWARGRMNATVIMISQGAMALGGVIWGSAGAIAGASYTLLGAAVLFLTSLLLVRRISINFAGDLDRLRLPVLATIASTNVRPTPTHRERRSLKTGVEAHPAWRHQRYCISSCTSISLGNATDQATSIAPEVLRDSKSIRLE
jgi:hypothetical protein